MSGQKKLLKAVKNNRVVAMPSKKVERPILDREGNPILDKDGVVQTETVQLYKIKKMH
jgi:ABC-type Fe3+-hydroxamate transport system substrate-binding protein